MTIGSLPLGIVAGPDGNLWFTEAAGLGGLGAIGEINPTTHVISEFASYPPSEPVGTQVPVAPGDTIIVGPDHNLWFTAGLETIGQFNPITHQVNEFSLPVNDNGVELDSGGPDGIAAGTDGNIWFTDYSDSLIGVLDLATKNITQFAIPTADGRPLGITLGPDNDLWFVEQKGNNIGQFDPDTRAFNEYSIPTTYSAAHRIISGAGNLWFTESSAGNIGEVVLASSGGGGGGLSAHAEYVTAVFNDVLGRASDPGGLAYWTQQLDSGAAVSSVAEAIAHSDEYYADFVIKPAYLMLLGRAADDSGVKFWTARMHGGATDQELEADLVSSPEFFTNAGGKNVLWVDAVYRELLGRAADQSGEGFWNGRLMAGESLNEVAQGIAGSTENNTQLINDDYFHYLGRAADSGGLDYWLGQFAAGKTNEDVIAGFTGSPEYYRQHSD